MITNKIGVMQGRLLPKYLGRYQAHPLGYWDKEFQIAATLGLDCIEFIFDYNDYFENPLYNRQGIIEIQNSIAKSGVGVRSICADFFMEAPFHHVDTKVVKHSQQVMLHLLKNASELQVADIVIPCVDESSLKGEEAVRRFVENMQSIVEEAEARNINLSLETDLSPKEFAEVLAEFPSQRVTVNYDTGNSASLGFDPIAEFEAYGARISDIHIKDRKYNGGSVFLGTGDVNFSRFFEALSTINYTAPFIMQVLRDEEGLQVFTDQLALFKTKMLKN